MWCTPPYLDPFCPKIIAPTFYWPKLSLSSLVLDFGPQLGPPSYLTPVLAPTTLNLVYSTLIGPPHPGGSVLDFGSNSAPLTHCPITSPHHLKPSVHLPNGITYTWKQTPPHCIGQKLSPDGLVLDFGSNSALPHALPDCTTWPPQTQCMPAK